MLPKQSTDPDYLRGTQYATSANLAARIRVHELYSTNRYDQQRWSFDLLSAVAGERATILEVGAGRGDLWAKNADRLPPEWQVTLTDFSQGMLDDAQKMLGAAADHFTWQVADAQELPFDDGAFDVVLAHFMLYHVPDREKAMREFRRVLKPHGVFMAFTLGEGHMRELNAVIFAAFAETQTDASEFTHRGFRLENGAAQIRTAFGDVTMIPYVSDLRIEDAESVVNYVRSVRTTDERHLAYIREFVTREIAVKGHFFVSKETGLFVARGHA